MNSLVMTHYRPHRPASGAALRNWQNISALASLGPVDVVTVGVEETDEPIERVREWVPFPLTTRSRWDRIKTVCAPLRPGIYPGIDLYHSQRVASWLRQRASQGRYDVAVIETISLASYLDDLRYAADRVVFDAHNVEGALDTTVGKALSSAASPSVDPLKRWVLNRRLIAAEGRVVRGADLVWVCSDPDAREIAQVYGRRTGLTVVPNAVDVDAYRRPGASPAGGDWSRMPVTMVYPALFAYFPNEDAALRLIREVLPAVRARGHDARVVLVGRDATPALVNAAAQTAGVELTGAVESIVPYLEQPCVVTLPIQLGGGTRLKILEAFAVGRPVVSTAKGAEGLDTVDGEQILIRDDPDSIAAAVVELWRHPIMRANLCDKALQLVRSHYSWHVAAQRVAHSLGVASPRAHPPDTMGPARATGHDRIPPAQELCEEACSP